MSIEQITLVGGGQASAVAARTLRRIGYAGRLTIIASEPWRPYQRPPLSKEFLAGATAVDSGLDLLPEAWCAEAGVEILSGSPAIKLNAAAREILLEDGTVITSDRILLATGSRARTLDHSPGDRIHHLRTVSDAEALRSQLLPGRRLTVIGAGFIGCEVASTARELGLEVTILEAGPAPMVRVLGQTLGTACGEFARAAGVDVQVGVKINSINQAGSEVTVETEGGPVVSDLLVIGIGNEPNDQLAREAGIACGNGILVNKHCETDAEGIYAAGDVANLDHPSHGRFRAEHFDSASKQAAVAARNMLGAQRVVDDPHWFWSDQFGLNLQLVGHPDPAAELIIRGDISSRQWSAWWWRDGLVSAAFTVDSADDMAVARALVDLQLPIPAEALAAPEVDLIELMEG